MLIKYNRPNVHALSSFDGKEIYSLKPGWNEFPSHIWKAYEKDSEIKRLIEDKHIELFAEKVIVTNAKGKKITQVVGQDDEEFNLKVLDEKKAIELVKGTLNRDMLARWSDEENRHKVKREIEKQLKPLLPENKTAS